jgi:capsular exopolysaccharide synthesis family protein
LEEQKNRPVSKISKLNKEFDLDLAILVLKKNKMFPILLILIALSLSYIYLRYTKPVYESSAVIQRTSQDEGKRILDIDGFDQESDLSEDVELLRSTFLLDKALRNLTLGISYYSEGEILTEEKYLQSSYHITLLELKDSSLVGTPISVENSNDNINLSYMANGKPEKISIKQDEVVENEFFRLIFKVNNQKQFFQSSKENSLYFVFNNYENLTSRLHPSLNVFALNREAGTIQVSFKSNNRQLSTDVVNSIITTFFEYDLEKKRQSSANILDFIDSQLDTVFSKLKESEVAIQSFKDGSSVKDPEYVANQVLEKSSELQNQLMDLDFEIELIEDVENSVQMSDRIEIYKVIPAVTGTNYESLVVAELEELHELLVRKEDLSYSVTPDNDILKKVESNIASQSDNIFRILKSIKNQLKFKRNSIQQKIFEIEGKLYGIPEKEMELSRLNRMFNLNEKYYTLLIEKKTEYAISKAGYTMDNMILKAPNDAVLISPNRNLVYTASVILALLIGIIYLLIRYLTFNEIHEAEELKRLLEPSVGFIGVIPKVDMKSDTSSLLVDDQPKSVLAESCRHMRSNLGFILNQDDSNVIAVSSSVSGEGKTFVAINMAGIIAMTGKKVLIIDLDLRKPKVHFGFNKENKEGMSSILAGKAKWQDCVQKTNLEGLNIITAGAIPPNPSELIIGKTLDTVIEEFKSEYDTIFIDNPPVGIVSDGISVLNKADCPIYVFRANYSKRFYTQRVNELVTSNQIPKLFVALNGLELGRKGYGYGYGDYYSDGKVRASKKWQFWKK